MCHDATVSKHNKNTTRVVDKRLPIGDSVRRAKNQKRKQSMIFIAKICPALLR